MADQVNDTAPPSKSPSSSSAYYKSLVRKKKIALGRPVSPTPSELARGNEEDMEPDATVLSNVYGAGRLITLHPGKGDQEGTVVLKKAGQQVRFGELDALRVAAAGGVPVPEAYGSGETTAGGRFRITMQYMADTQTLADVWPGLTHAEKTGYARQLRAILTTMRAIPPPPDGYIGACDGKEIRDGRVYDTYRGPVCHGEAAFKEYLLSCLHAHIPAVMRDAYAQRLAQQKPHRTVLTHGDLAPRNILVRDRDKAIVALVDWEDAGWYPEYWEYVKLFQRMAAMERDWPSYAADIFPQLYPDELVDYEALSRWQRS
ncbi:hypothetical protein SCUCBS95973_005438 [Sporothrix curviconia]|uniref:non-specific serine/threonine protein kinase n=1 Tax=Sporothrix curviconia TaxID=1260050 RepID=A0ABP0BWU6_9PEZI